MPAGTLLERSAHTGVFIPDIIRHFACRIGTFVVVEQLPIRGDANSMIVKSEVIFVLDEVKYVGVGAGKFSFKLLAERIMPYEPVAHHKAELVSYDFYICSIVIADSYVKRAVWLEDFFTDGHPVFRPGNVVFAFDLIVVFVVFVADVERRVGKDKVGKGLAGPAQNLYAVAAYYPVEKFLHSDIL